MKFKDLFKAMIPLVIGILIGAGLTRNKYVMSILLGYFVFMIIFSLVKDRIVKVKESVDKKSALKTEGIGIIQDVADATYKGHVIGANMFDKWYKEYAFYFGVCLFLSIFLLAFFKLWYWVLICFLGFNMFVVMNQVQRSVREIKEYLGRHDTNETKTER